MKYQQLLDSLTVTELTAIYNGLAETFDVVKIDVFPSKQDGVKRLMWLISEKSVSLDRLLTLVPDTVRKKLENAADAQKKELNDKVAAAVRNRPLNSNVVPANGGKKIKIIAQGNPKRKGSASYERFALYKNGMTVAEALKAGVTKADLAWDQKRGFIQLDD